MRSTYKKVSGMTAEIKIRRCYGCGAILQSTNRFEAGYVSKKREGKDEGLCDRCFDLRHPSEGGNQTLDSDFADLLQKARDRGALFCYIIDSFAFDASIVPGLNEIIGKNILAILTKSDILPENADANQMIENYRNALIANGIEPVDIIVTSAFKNFNFNEFIEIIDKYRNGKDVIFVGANQVGKSSLVNNFLMNYDNETGRNITSERIGNEGLSLICIPLDKNSALYDTPGIFNPKSILNQVERRAMKYIIPHVAVSSINDVLKAGESLFLGALSRVDNLSNNNLKLKLFFARDVIRTKSKIEKADVSFTTLCENGEGKPASATVRSISDLEPHKFTLPNEGQCLISIFGFGKIVIESPEAETIVVYAPREVAVNLYTESAWLKIK